MAERLKPLSNPDMESLSPDARNILRALCVQLHCKSIENLLDRDTVFTYYDAENNYHDVCMSLGYLFEIFGVYKNAKWIWKGFLRSGKRDLLEYIEEDYLIAKGYQDHNPLDPFRKEHTAVQEDPTESEI